MTDYQQIDIILQPCNADVTDVTAALLADIGYESFVPSGTGLTAYVRDDRYDAQALEQCLDSLPFAGITHTVTATFVEGEDWNREWEKHYFRPIVVGDKCVIHSTFHTDVPHADYDIVIDPKMAFGTGHHATTSQMLRYILDTDCRGLNVTDMGTGTGILAILCAMRGAKEVTGIEIDPGAWENAIENVKLNGVGPYITLKLGDATLLPMCPMADILLANINRNIIIDDIRRYADALRAGGIMLLSGFYEHDIPMIMRRAEPLGLRQVSHTVDNDWCALKLIKDA